MIAPSVRSRLLRGLISNAICHVTVFATGIARALHHDGWKVRRTDLDFLISSAAREAVRREDIVIIDDRTIREVWLRQWAS
jgi:hypothetical protein